MSGPQLPRIPRHPLPHHPMAAPPLRMRRRRRVKQGINRRLAIALISSCSITGAIAFIALGNFFPRPLRAVPSQTIPQETTPPVLLFEIS
ncbi:MAG: hypothetical protein AAGF75_00705 [Cyanobacteria bacterium P01_H01_bin.130]